MACTGVFPENREEAVKKAVSYSQIQTYLQCPQKYLQLRAESAHRSAAGGANLWQTHPLCNRGILPLSPEKPLTDALRRPTGGFCRGLEGRNPLK